MRFNDYTCAKCGREKLVSPDKGLFCSECERKMSEQFARMRPDKSKKLKIVTEYVE